MINRFSIALILVGVFSLFIADPVLAKDKKNKPEEMEKIDLTKIGEDPVTVMDFFRQSALRRSELSPNGDWITFQRYNSVIVGNTTTGFYELISIKNAYNIDEVTWISDHQVAVQVSQRAGHGFGVHLLEIGVKEDGLTRKKLQYIKKHGFIVDPMPEVPNVFLYAVARSKRDWFYRTVHKVDATVAMKDQLKEKTQIHKKNYKALYWLTDDNHKLKYAIGSSDDSEPMFFIQRRRSRGWSEVWRGEEKARFLPLQLSKDGKFLWALSDHGLDTLSLIKFDLDEFEPADVLYTIPGIDIEHVDFSSQTGEPLYVSWLEKGKLNRHFFSDAVTKLHETLSTELPSQLLSVSSMDNHGNMTVVGTSPTHQTKTYYCLAGGKNCHEIGSSYPRRDSVELAPVIPLQVQSTDDITVDAFLVLPANPNNQDDIPLIVNPHGGPIGVRDHGFYNGDTQWLAYKGFAVLQVNYRGSSGYGKEFKQKGMKEWGRGIEDDLEYSLKKALQEYPQINKDRVCIMGGSYGGYSALFSVIRSPDLYKCAVSIAGVTDLALIFTENGVKFNNKTRDFFVKSIGDPLTDLPRLKKYSPIYRYKEIGVPVFLAHGMRDRVVDVEHSYRLNLLLDLTTVEHELHTYKTLGHGFSLLSQHQEYYDDLMPFLNKHLGMPVENSEPNTEQTTTPK